MTARPGSPTIAAGRALTMLPNSVALIGSKVGLMGLGFVFWLLAARQFDAAAVGLAAAAVSAMMLCTQIALLGVGSAVIRLLPAATRRPGPLLNSAFTIVTALAVVTGVGFLALAALALDELRAVAVSPLYALLFVTATVTGTVGILLDQLATSLRRGDHAFVRGVAFGLVALAALAVAAALDATDSRALLAPWVVAGVAGLSIGARQLRRSLAGYVPRPAAGVHARRLVAVGIPNWGLTLAERAPGLVLPIVVVELLSPQANAVWYVAWMMAWVVYVIPIQVGMTLFAEISREPASLPAALQRARRVALGVGVPAAAAVAVLAGPLLGLLGAHYAESGALALRILAAGVVPLTFVQLYYAACRGRGRLSEAIAVAWVTGIVAVAAAAAAGATGGLVAMAAAFVVVQAAAAACATGRLRALHRAESAPGRRGSRLAPTLAARPS